MRTLKILFILLTLALPARGADDIQFVAALWNDFVAALRRGDYRSAHALFSPESRKAMPYAEFIQEYGPLSAAREMVLAKPETQSTRLEEDWAEIVYGGLNAGSERRFRVGVSLVKNNGVWGLVAARNEMPERLEAGARGLLRTAAQWRGLSDAGRRLADLAALHTGRNPVLRHYRFETDGAQFKALPTGKGLRAFHVDAWGNILEGEFSVPGQPHEGAARAQPGRDEPARAREAAAFESRLPGKPVIPLLDDRTDGQTANAANTERISTPAPTPNGIPEMREPPPSSPFPDVPPELPEPPASPLLPEMLPELSEPPMARDESNPPASVPITLPDLPDLIR